MKLTSKKKPVIERFLSFVDKSEKCWIWKGAFDGLNRYGTFWDGKRQINAHRYSYFYFNNIIDTSLYVCHKCDNPKCVNPDHLFLGTQEDNMKDMYNKNRQRKKCTYFSGTEHCNAKFNTQDIRNIRKLYNVEKLSSYKIASIYSCARPTINRIIRGISYANVK